MKNIFFATILSITISILTCHGQNSRDRENILRGASILAHQYYKDMEISKAKILTCFALEFDSDNEKIRALAKNITENTEILLDERLIDNGLKYSKYLLATLKRMPSHPEALKRKSLLAHIIYTIAPEKEEVFPLLNTSRFKRYTDKLFPKSSSQKEYSILETTKSTIINIDYRLPDFLPAINQLNKTLSQSDIKVYVKSSRVEYETYTNENDILIHEGPAIIASQHAQSLNGISVFEFLEFITHTLALRYDFHEEEKTIVITDAHKGQDSYPHYLKKSAHFKSEITKQFFNAKKKYSKKDIQLKGIITKLRDNKKGKLLIELDNYFIAEILK